MAILKAHQIIYHLIYKFMPKKNKTKKKKKNKKNQKQP